MSDKKIVYVDMDDTLCDYKGNFSRHRLANPGLLYPQSIAGFFLELHPLPGALGAMAQLMQDFDVYILTRPSVLNPLCYTEKRLWVEKNLGIEMCHRLILSPQKGLLRGDYLIDDVLWPDFAGKQLHFGQKGATTWTQTLSALYADAKISDKNIIPLSDDFGLADKIFM